MVEQINTSGDLVRIVEEVMRSYRGLEDSNLCRECQGWGVRVYGDTSTWRGGAGGQTMTNGVCNVCWGSGDKDRPWPSHRQINNGRGGQ